jgi:hypothetical protein
MSSVSEARALVRRIAEPREVGDSVKAAIVRAARRLGFRFHRTRDLWYGDARRIDADEMDRLRELAAKAEARTAVANLLALRNSLAQADPDFHRPTIAALDDALRGMGAEVGAVAFRDD